MRCDLGEYLALDRDVLAHALLDIVDAGDGFGDRRGAAHAGGDHVHGLAGQPHLLDQRQDAPGAGQGPLLDLAWFGVVEGHLVAGACEDHRPGVADEAGADAGDASFIRPQPCRAGPSAVRTPRPPRSR